MNKYGSAATMAPKLTLYVDTVSPFAYEAYYILRVCSNPLGFFLSPASKTLSVSNLDPRV